MSEAPDAYLSPGEFVDSDHPAVREFAAKNARGGTDLERAVSLYYAVRDGIRYNPFLDFSVDAAYRASSTLERGEGFCVGKSALLAACARSLGIPARVGFADVKNHLTTPRLRERMGTDLFIYHGYAELFLDGKWVKATPVFNDELCRRFRVKPLEFDGREDSIFHPFDADDRRHMEYVNDHGTFADVPAQRIQREFRAYYPNAFTLGEGAARETFG
jgi:transglutaminase-like putative cysteine protease